MPNWTLDELVLALELYMKHRPSIPDDGHPDVVALSEFLRAMAPAHTVDQKFRNGNGVSMKLGNFRRLDPSFKGGGLMAGSRLEELLWNAFADDARELGRIARNIRQKAQGA